MAGSGGRALVLGGGGIAGVAWEAGIVTGLRRAGIDLGHADLIVGTSAGSIVGTLLATDADLAQAIEKGQTVQPNAMFAETDFGAVMAAFAVLFDPSIEPVEARRRVGEMALAASAGDEQRWIATIGSRFSARDWPDRRLLITAVDAANGQFVVWDRDSSADLLLAVASSCAVPIVFPPVTINGRRYIDGGVRSATNADLASGADAVVVVEPLAHLSPRQQLAAELAVIGTDAVTTIAPDQATIDAFGPNVLDPSVWEPAYGAGLEQSIAVRRQVADIWK